MISGTILAFPLFAALLSTPLQLSRFHISIIISTANCGSPVALLCGFIHSRLGTRLTAFLGSSLITFGYTWIALLVLFSVEDQTDVSHKYDFHSVLIAAVLINSGSILNYIAGLMAVSSSFDKQLRDKLYGLLSSSFALSSGLCGIVQKTFLTQPSHILLFLSSLSASSLFTSFLLSSHKLGPQGLDLSRLLTYGRSNRKILWVSFLVVLLSLVLSYDGYTSSTGGLSQNSAKAPFLVLGILISFAVLIINEHPLVTNVVSGSAMESTTYTPLDRTERAEYGACYSKHKHNEDVNIVLLQPTYYNVLRAACTTQFINVFLIVAFAYGCSITLLNNAPDLVLSRELIPASVFDGKSFSPSYVSYVHHRSNGSIVLFSTCNVFGRLFSGIVLGYKNGSTRFFKVSLLLISLLLLSFGFTMAIFVAVRSLFLCFLLVGFSLGSVMTLVPALISEWFGEDMLPSLYGLIGLAFTIGGLLYPTLLFKVQRFFLADQPTINVFFGGSQETFQTYCIGPKCYLFTFFIDCVLCLLSICLCVQLLFQAKYAGRSLVEEN